MDFEAVPVALPCCHALFLTQDYGCASTLGCKNRPCGPLLVGPVALLLDDNTSGVVNFNADQEICVPVSFLVIAVAVVVVFVIAIETFRIFTNHNSAKKSISIPNPVFPHHSPEINPYKNQSFLKILLTCSHIAGERICPEPSSIYQLKLSGTAASA